MWLALREHTWRENYQETRVVSNQKDVGAGGHCW